MVQSREQGEIRVIQAEFSQDWLTNPIEQDGQRQAAWRTDPGRSGVGGCIGDIGTHAYQLACFVSGLQLDQLAADLSTFVTGRRLDDNAHVLLRFKGGARGLLFASQVCPGNENGLRLRIYGSKGGLEWHQEDPNYLWHSTFGQPKRLITRGGPGFIAAAASLTRVPPGHPEGYLEGFANLYGEMATAIRSRQRGRRTEEGFDFPGIADGLAGMAFIDACVRSSTRNGKWVKL